MNIVFYNIMHLQGKKMKIGISIILLTIIATIILTVWMLVPLEQTDIPQMYLLYSPLQSLLPLYYGYTTGSYLIPRIYYYGITIGFVILGFSYLIKRAV